MGLLQLFFDCWLTVTKQKRYQDKWLSDETYYRAIKAQFPNPESLGFDRGRMNKAISHYGGRAGSGKVTWNKAQRQVSADVIDLFPRQMALVNENDKIEIL
jgi:hypothetical protein